MNNAELDKLLTSTDAAVRRAYALGRKDALDQLVKYARSDEVVTPPLALGPPERSDLQEPEPIEIANDHGADERDADMTPARVGSAGITGMILDFVYPPRAG